MHHLVGITKLILAAIAAIAAIATVVMLSPALASHAPGARTWQGIVNSDETVNPKCTEWRDGACVKS